MVQRRRRSKAGNEHPLDLSKIPEELRLRPQWVGSLNGIPKNPKRPKISAKTNDPSTWGTFDEAVAGLDAGHYDGIAFIVTAGDPYVIVR